MMSPASSADASCAASCPQIDVMHAAKSRPLRNQHRHLSPLPTLYSVFLYSTISSVAAPSPPPLPLAPSAPLPLSPLLFSSLISSPLSSSILLSPLSSPLSSPLFSSLLFSPLFSFSFPFSPALPSSLLPSYHSFSSPPVLSPLLPCPPLFSPPLPSSHSFTSPLVLSSPLLRIIRRANSLFVLLFLPKLSFVNLLFTSSFFILSAARIYTYQSFLALRLSISLLLLFLSLLFCLSSSISPFVFLSSFCAPLPQHSSLLLLYFRIFFLYPPCSYSSNPLIDIFLILSISNFHALTSSIT